MKEIYRAYKYRIYPNKAQKELINKTFGCCRFVYNFCRAEQKKQEDMWQLVKEMQQQGYCFNDYKSKFFNRFENIKFITELKKTYTWLKEADNTVLQSSVDLLLIDIIQIHKYVIAVDIGSGKKDETIREWICENCGTKLDRDTNASINILREGLRMLAV